MRATVSMLYGVVIPPEGGNTEFCDMRLAYEALKASLGRLRRNPAPDGRSALVMIERQSSFVMAQPKTSKATSIAAIATTGLVSVLRQ